MGSWILRVFLIALLVALALIAIPQWWHSTTQRDNLSRIRRELNAQGLDQISVAVDHAKFRLSGTVPVHEFRDEAIDIARRHIDDSSLEDDIEVAGPVSPYSFSALLADKKLVIQGYVNSKRQKKRLTSQLARLPGTEGNTIRLRYAEGEPLHWLGIVETAVSGLLLLREGDLQIRYHQIVISGEAESEDVIHSVQQALEPLETMEYAVDMRGVAVAMSCIEKVQALAIRSPLRFERGRARIASESQRFLDELAVTVRTCPETAFVVNGYTDNHGDAAKNLQLSQARAEAVVRAMEERGIPPSRFTAIGHGEASPVADNRTARGRARNRRIEFNVKNPS